MPLHIIGLVLFAAVLHATWNALLRSGTDRLWSMTIMCIAVAIVSSIALLFLGLPPKQSWACAVLSALLHIAYNLFLVRSYQLGDLGQIYPIARGVSPILVALGAVVFAGEKVSPGEVCGIAMISTGIISVAFRRGKLVGPGLPYALGTGCFIAAYSVTDGIGVRLSGAPMAYTTLMCAMWGVLMPAAYSTLRGAKSLFTRRAGLASAALGGLVSLLAYGIVIYAMSDAPMGPVSALRETSVLFAALIGYFYLGETMSVRKILACAFIAIGACLIG